MNGLDPSIFDRENPQGLGLVEAQMTGDYVTALSVPRCLRGIMDRKG